MTVRPPRQLAPKIWTDNPAAALDYEIAQEKAATLGRLGRALETALDPDALLAALKALERELGRVASTRWGPRAIDVDILDVDGVKRDDPHLTIPHARLYERAFALVPLAEIEPAFAAARAALPADDLAAVERIGTFESEGVP